MGAVDNYGGQCVKGFRGLRRRKHVDSDNLKISHGDQQLAKRLNVIDLIGIGNVTSFFDVNSVYLS